MGINNFGPTNFHGPVAGRDIVYHRQPEEEKPASRAEVGVLTALPVEMGAVIAQLRRMYDYHDHRLAQGRGPLAHEAWTPDSRGRQVRIAAVQALQPGTESAALAFRGLVDGYRPATVLLVGIAGAVAERVRIGDVVLSDRVIAYDARKEEHGHTHRRGQAQSVAAPLGHRVNEFLAATPAKQYRARGDSFSLHYGPIGSGNAVVKDADSEIRRWLTEVNEKVLAVETEAAGVAQSFHEAADGARGWLTIRGIADAADELKNDQYHVLAARHAAEVMTMLVPFLHPGP